MFHVPRNIDFSVVVRVFAIFIRMFEFPFSKISIAGILDRNSNFTVRDNPQMCQSKNVRPLKMVYYIIY